MRSYSLPQSVLIALMLVLSGSIAREADAQQDPLSAICQGFLSSSGAPAPGNANVLCSCLVKEVQENLSAAEMQAYQTATQSLQPLSQSVQTKITAIAVKCLSQAQ